MRTREMTPRQVHAIALRLHRSGYRPISRKYQLASRIDRPDWKEEMARRHPGGDAWVQCLGVHAGEHYRRVMSKDRTNMNWRVYRELRKLGGRFSMDYQEVVTGPIKVRRLTL